MSNVWGAWSKSGMYRKGGSEGDWVMCEVHEINQGCTERVEIVNMVVQKVIIVGVYNKTWTAINNINTSPKQKQTHGV